MPLVASLCFLLLPLPSPVGRPGPTASDDERPSLEEFMRQMNERRAAARAELEPRIAVLIARIHSLPADEPAGDQLDELTLELESLPPEAAPLLVLRLDPGPGSSGREDFASGLIHRTLRAIGLSAITPELLALAESGSPAGRRLAVDLLAHSSDHLDAGRGLRELWTAAPRGLGPELATALLLQPGAQNRSAVMAALLGDSEERTGWALAAFVALQPSGTDQALTQFLARDGGVLQHIELLLDFYFAQPDLFREPQALSLVAHIRADLFLSPQSLLALEALPDLRRRSRTTWLDELRGEARVSEGARLEAVLVCLARCGDRTARREVMSASEAWVDRGESSHAAHLERARVLMRLHDYNRATQDFKRVFERYRYPSGRRWEVGVSLARAYALDNRLRQAADVLEEIGLTEVQKRELLVDSDFTALVEHPRYSRVLH